jgi:hypothetical protein
LIGTTRIIASRAAQRTAASDAGDPSTPTTMLDRAACLHIASSPLEVPLAIMVPTPVAVIVAANNVTMPTMSKRTLATTRVFRWAAAEFRQGGRSQLLGDHVQLAASVRRSRTVGTEITATAADQ